MRRDYRLYELNDEEFENLVVRICIHWLGSGVTPFATGKDGGRDGKFLGTATCFPSVKEPLAGHFVLQAKHVAAPDKSCSDKDFGRQLKKEHPKIIKLIQEGICDHYIVFTNRKLTGGADQKITKALLSLTLKSAHVIGNERIHVALDEYADLQQTLPNHNDPMPFRFQPDDLVEVIGAFHDYTASSAPTAFNSAQDFDAVKIRDQKNKINGLSKDYYQQNAARS